MVGAGLAGLCTAALCAADGASVVVIEAGTVAARTTGHSTAKLTALHGLTYSKLTRGKGQETAVRYAAANTEGLLRLKELVTRWSIDCDLIEATAYTCAATPAGVEAVEQEAEAARAAGLPVELVTSTELAVPVERAVALRHQAHFDPVRLCRGLVTELRATGVRVIEGARVMDVDEAGGGCTVSGEGWRLACEAAVVTTHLPVVDPALLAGRVRPERSYVVAGPVAGDPCDGMYLAHDAGWSIRPARSAHGSLLLVGGEGHPMTDHVDSARHYSALEAFATDAVGVDVQYRWSAFDYTTTDGLAFIGRLSPRGTRRYVATGFHKWGMTTSMASAMIISDAIAGRDNPYAATFDSTRIAPTVSRKLIETTAKVATRFVGDRLAARRRTELPGVGEGKVMQRDGVTVAIARDQAGTLHSVKAKCTHLGCIVGYNDGEQTWDCPCHGSRFNLDGTVLDGPATAPLEAVALGPSPGTSNSTDGSPTT